MPFIDAVMGELFMMKQPIEGISKLKYYELRYWNIWIEKIKEERPKG